MAPAFRPNHFHTDSLGDPVTCTGNHVHPERSPLTETKALLARLDDARSVTNSTLSDKLVAGVTATALVAIVERLDALVLAIEPAPAASVELLDDGGSYRDGPLDDRVSDDGLVHYEDLDDEPFEAPRNPLLDKLDQTPTPEVETKGKKGRKV